MAQKSSQRQSFLIGGGIASLAAAVYLIRDGKIPGKNIHIYEELEEIGGSLDASGNPEAGYLMRGGRMFEERFVCTYDLLSQIPSLDNPKISAREDIFNFYKEASWHSNSRLIDKEGKTLDVSTLGFNNRDRLDLSRLMGTPEELLGDKKIEECFGPHFFTTNFWFMWCSMFAFEPWHSAIEMRRYLWRFIHHFPTLADMSSIYHTRYSQYHSMVVPLQKWLRDKGVDFQTKIRVTDLEFVPGAEKLQVRKVKLLQQGEEKEIAVNKEDLVFVTNGSMTAASSVGSMTSAALTNRGAPGGSWELWEKLAEHRPGLGNPRKFISQIDRSKWLSFTVTTRDPQFRKLMENFTHNEFGRGGLITFRDSNWLMTINLHHYPVYPDQPKDAYIWWGYGLYPDRVGDYVPKKMADCNGQELLTEALSHLHIDKERESIIEKSHCIPCMMPYITSQFMPRAKGDRPLVVPKGSVNLAFLGQYCEIPEDTVFTVEYSVRSAKVAVCSLLELKEPVPPLYKGRHDLGVMLRAFKESLSL